MSEPTTTPVAPDAPKPASRVIDAAFKELRSLAESLEKSMRRRRGFQEEIDTDLGDFNALVSFVERKNPEKLEYDNVMPQLIKDVREHQAEHSKRFLDLNARPGSAVSGEHEPERAAVRTLTALGYTHEGGIEWRPPMGKDIPLPKMTLGENVVMSTKDGELFFEVSPAPEWAGWKGAASKEAVDLLRKMSAEVFGVELDDVIPPEERGEPLKAAHITPTIGRRVWLRVRQGWEGLAKNDDQPLDAGIVYVWNEQIVNLDVCDHAGQHHAMRHVFLRQPDQPEPGLSRWAEWMPYQQQAVKA